ncbi:MAG: hypothetical protein HKN25_02970 [Pyrinomonadaceae bacterium]|nr:hypothetical protein [Pyrinomonadaceae bacterium]
MIKSRNIYNAVFVFQILFVALSQICMAQDSYSNEDPIIRGADVIRKARTAIYENRTSKRIETLKLILSGESFTKTNPKLERQSSAMGEVRQKIRSETLIDFAGFARTHLRTETSNAFTQQPLKSNLVSIVNGKRFDTRIVALVGGREIETAGLRNGLLKQREKNDTENIGGKRNEPSNLTGSELFLSLVDSIHPFLLQRPGMAELRFTFLGKAEADGITANVLERVSDSGRSDRAGSTTRYFFDSVTNLLLLVTSKSVTDSLEIKSSAFFSAHGIKGGIKIPTKIKTEQETIVKGKTTKAVGTMIESKTKKITVLSVEDFEINPKFHPDIFEIMGKK